MEKLLKIQPCKCISHWNSSAIGIIVTGIKTRSAEFIKLAIEHSIIIKYDGDMDSNEDLGKTRNTSISQESDHLGYLEFCLNSD